jgi:hypothetical protein
MTHPNTAELQRVAKSPAYQAGFADGQAWNYEPEDVQVDGWDRDTINAIGAREFGRHIGISEAEVDKRSEAWVKACAEYNRGCVDGVTYARSRPTLTPKPPSRWALP